MSRAEAVRRRKVANSSPNSSPGGSAARRRSSSTRQYRKYFWPLLCCAGAFFCYCIWALWSNAVPDPLQRSSLPRALVDDIYNETSWGTYRPQLYFGLKTKQPESPLFGLIWYQQPQEKFIQGLPLRHWCEQGDNVKFAWTEHDGRTFGREQLEDRDLQMSIDWLSVGKRSWHVQMSGNSNASYALVFYLALQEHSTSMKPSNTFGSSVYTFLRGSSPLIGQFTLRLRMDKMPLSQNALSHAAYRFPQLMDMKDMSQLLLYSLGRRRDDESFDFVLVQNAQFPGPANDGTANIALLQLTTKGKFSLDLELTATEDSPLEDFKQSFEQNMERFDRKFDEVFPIESTKMRRDLGKHALSNLLGGVGVWHGHSLVRDAGSPSVAAYGPLSLLSAVPSRPFFPRGFLWDEGFHNLIIHHFDPQLTVQIFGSWLDALSANGWIPREMILDAEARAKVPAEFVMQSTLVANPPTFFLVLEKLLKNTQVFNRFSARISALYPRLKQHYVWLRDTQRGPRPGTMQWHGRNRTIQTELNPKSLPSGMDDFPRATHPSPEEYHLDLRCWMAFCSKVLRQLAETFGDSAFVPVIEEDVRLFNDVDALDKLHWSEHAKQYADFGLHSGRVQLVQEIVRKRGEPQGQQQQAEQRIFVRRVVEEPRPRLVEDVFGYANLFPMLLRLLPPDHPKLGIMLHSLNQTELLWTPFGLRSLSTKSPYYLARNTEHDPPYWRGPVWVNINYLALDALRYYARASGKFGRLSAELYAQLRDNLLRNLEEQYAKTGFLWENYNDRTGDGMGTRAFTGWSALVLNILAEKFE